MNRLFILSILVCIVNPNKLPPQFRRCSIKDEACLAEATTDGIRHLKGIPELGVSSLNPLHVPKVSIPAGPKLVQVQQNFENYEVSGYDQSAVNKVDFNLKGGNVHFELIIPSYKLSGDYDYDGHMLGLPIKGKGRYVFLLSNVSFLQDFETEAYKKDGDDFLKFKSSTFRVTNVDNISFRLSNLYDGDEKRSAEMHKLMNTKWVEIFDEIGSRYLQVIGDEHLKIANALFSKVPLSEIFLKD